MVNVTDSSLVDVGDTLLVGSEQIFVSERVEVDLAVNTSGALTADDTDTALTLSGAPTDNLTEGEVIRVGSERMRVESVTSSTVVVVQRAWDGTNLAAHNTASDIYVSRRLTVERGVNGITAATALDDAAVLRYAVPGPIEELCIAEVIAAGVQERSGWGRTVGTGERQVELSGRALSDLRKRALAQYRRHVMVSL